LRGGGIPGGSNSSLSAAREKPFFCVYDILSFIEHHRLFLVAEARLKKFTDFLGFLKIKKLRRLVL